ncbi:hypothetical protein ACTOB_004527 [Actinoplanes oblitus]|uniref:Streptomyces killer toxin-like beta/gamma crystallin domain-containing protein n=1 Tax=Actinoplanes oblitus TaxID=3040509 RepID=A0ABY8W861_9ACTN|nr:hypothetical protein [Actinoplanes oblitus]WIM92579.1 hypothetical protein ACTOB_004527 [Actinoplanes oblitus]
MKIATKLAGVASAALLGMGGVLFAATPAQAYVSNCQAWTSNNAGYAVCWAGTGSFRVLVDCANVGRVSTIGGDWIYRQENQSTQASIAGCGSGYATNVRWDAR